MIWIETKFFHPETRKDVLLFCASSREWERGWWDDFNQCFIVENTGRIDGVTHWAEVELPEVQS